MKKKLFGVFALSIGLLLASCGDAETEAGEIEVSTEMAAFIKDFDGDYETVEKALAKFGANEDIVDHDMGMYDLAEPKVTAKNGDCYTLVCKSGQVENTYEICWENKKIISIKGE